MRIAHSSKLKIFMSFILFMAFVCQNNVDAQSVKNKKKKRKTEEVVKPKKPKKSIATLTKSSKKIEGLFTIFQDTVSGDLKMLIKKNQLDKDYIYFSQIADGVTEA